MDPLYEDTQAPPGHRRQGWVPVRDHPSPALTRLSEVVLALSPRQDTSSTLYPKSTEDSDSRMFVCTSHSCNEPVYVLKDTTKVSSSQVTSIK